MAGVDHVGSLHNSSLLAPLFKAAPSPTDQSIICNYILRWQLLFQPAGSLAKGIQGAPTAAITCSYIVIQWLLAVFLGRNVPHLERRASSSAESRALRTGRQTPQWVPGSNDEREQSTSPQNVPFGHMNYFELKLLKKQPAHKGHYDPPLSPESKKSISCEVTLCTKTVAGIFVIRVGNSRHKRLYILSLLQ